VRLLDEGVLKSESGEKDGGKKLGRVLKRKRKSIKRETKSKK